jgi:hypothetical protein
MAPAGEAGLGLGGGGGEGEIEGGGVECTGCMHVQECGNNVDVGKINGLGMAPAGETGATAAAVLFERQGRGEVGLGRGRTYWLGTCTGVRTKMLVLARSTASAWHLQGCAGGGVFCTH